MTPEEHNKYLAYSHFGFAGLFGLLLLGMLMMFGFMGRMLSGQPDAPPIAFLVFMWFFIAVIYGAMIIPSMIAGYGLLKKKSWAKTAAIIAGVMAAMHFPIGTAVSVYTFWFLFSDPGKYIFDKPTYYLPNGRQTWANEQDVRSESQYVPPPSPPDWR